MTRPTPEKHQNVDATLTLRLTQHDRELLQALVALRAKEMAESGVEVTAASYLRGLIRREAKTQGFVEGGSAAPSALQRRERRSP